MSYSNKTTGNFTIDYPTKEFTKTPNFIITNKKLKHFETLVLQFVLSLHPNTKLTQQLCADAFDVSLRNIERVFKSFHDKGIVTSYKKKNEHNLYDTFYDFHTDKLDGTRDKINDKVDGVAPDKTDGTEEKTKNKLEASNNKGLKDIVDNNSIPTDLSGHINTIKKDKTINNTKEKIYKKESEDSLDLYDQTVKLMKDKLLLMTKPENLIKEFGLEEVNKHLAYLDYFDLDKQHEKYKRNLTFSFLESLRNNLEAPPEYRRIQHQAIYEERMITAKPILDLFNIKSRNEIDLYLETCKSINQMKKKDKLNLNQYLKHELELVDNKRRRLGQYVLSFEEKSKLIEDLTLNYEVEKNQRISLAKQTVQHDIKKFFNITKIVIKENPLSLMSLKDDLQEFNNNVNDYLFNLEIFILRLSNKDLENCA